MKFIVATIALTSTVTPVFANEALLKGSEIMSVLNDQVLTTTQDGQPVNQIFQKSGVTFYNAGGNQSQGAWNVTADQFCSQWQPNPAWVCYDVARDGNKVTFISKSGKRFEMSLSK